MSGRYGPYNISVFQTMTAVRRGIDRSVPGVVYHRIRAAAATRVIND